jgi:hypothetical protein
MSFWRRFRVPTVGQRAWATRLYLERFRREAKAAGRLHHTNMVGATLPGIQIGMAIQHDLTGRISLVTAKLIGGQNGLQFALLYGALGLAAGALGGGMGWMFGGGQSETYLTSGGTTLGRLGGATVGAFLLARFGALIGLLPGGGPPWRLDRCGSRCLSRLFNWGFHSSILVVMHLFLTSNRVS